MLNRRQNTFKALLYRHLSDKDDVNILNEVILTPTCQNGSDVYVSQLHLAESAETILLSNDLQILRQTLNYFGFK